MRIHPLRWALLCVSTASGALLARPAAASHASHPSHPSHRAHAAHATHRSHAAQAAAVVTIRPGDTIERLARRHHVSVHDIARANHITAETLLVDGRKLRIPLPAGPQTRTAARAEKRSRHAAGHPAQPWPGRNIVRTAFAYRGVPYVYGGTSRSGIDCSGFTGRVLAAQGVQLPRTAAEQFTRGKHVRGGELRPGDLVFFHTTRPGVSHVGIYIGGGRFVHASSAKGHVRTDTLASGYYHERLVGARRYR